MQKPGRGLLLDKQLDEERCAARSTAPGFISSFFLCCLPGGMTITSWSVMLPL